MSGAMKHIKFILPVITGLILYCCNKSKLDAPALGQLDQSALTNKSGVEGLLIGAYADLDGESGTNINEGSAASNWIYGSICGSEAYKGGPDPGDQQDIYLLETFSATAFNTMIAQKWAAVYDGISRANDVLRVMRKAKDMTEADTIEVRAEAVFLRAFYHFEAKKMWNMVPYIDENITIEAGNYRVANDKDIWPDIEADLLYAINHLPGKQTAPGRANKYAAEAFLAKSYLFQQNFSQAQPLLQDLIENGITANGDKYALFKNYHDNFDPLHKNGPESVFAAQMSVNDGSGFSGPNGNLGDFLNYPGNYGFGFFQPSQYLVNHFKTDAVTGLPDLDYFNDFDVTSDEGVPSDSPFVPYTGYLDPRLDWTVGRRGIPYLDWGNHPGANWIRNPAFGGPYSPKKNAVSQKEFGQYTSNEWGTPTINANNVNFIRFADVLLWYAEVLAERNALDSSTYYVNLIRARAKDSASWVYKYIDDANPMNGFSNTPAANYKVGLYPVFANADSAKKAIRYERMLELGMEGHRFFDLVRWNIADVDINAYLEKEKDLRDYLKTAFFKKGINEYFPIPYQQIVLSEGPDGVPMMHQNFGY